MYLFNNGVLVKECPAPVHHLSVSDDGDMIRIITNPDHLEGDTVHELLATLAADYNLEPFGTWENSVEYSVCFFPEGRDWAAAMENPIPNGSLDPYEVNFSVALEASTPGGEVSYLWVKADEDEIATMIAPLVKPCRDNFDYDALAELIPGLCFSDYDGMVKALSDAIIAICYFSSFDLNPTLNKLTFYERAVEKAMPSFVPILIKPFIDIANAMRAVGN